MDEPVNVERLKDLLTTAASPASLRNTGLSSTAEIMGAVPALLSALDAANELARVAEERPEPNAEWEAKAAAAHAKIRADVGDPEPDLTLTMLETWKAHAEPADSEGRITFSRSMLDAAEDALRFTLAQLALAAPLLEAGYAYQRALFNWRAANRSTTLLRPLDQTTSTLLAAALALPPRDGGQADG